MDLKEFREDAEWMKASYSGPGRSKGILSVVTGLLCILDGFDAMKREKWSIVRTGQGFAVARYFDGVHITDELASPLTALLAAAEGKTDA